jgi:predicted enzyme related to lactoylglutathione lyase
VNPLVHWELFANHAPTLGAFYAELFGWALHPLPDIGHVLIDTGAGAGINGGILTVADGWRQPMFYVRVDDLRSALDRVEQAGGATTLPPITEVVSFAQFSDPDGNIVGLVKRGDESPVSQGDAPPVMRFHIGSTKAAALGDFYRAVFGWRVQPAKVPQDAPLFDVDTGAEGIAGTIGTSLGTSPVTFYAAVPHADTYLDRARALGATAATPATNRADPAEAAYVIDPEGQPFGLISPG